MWASGSEVKDEKDHKQGLLEKATKGQKEVVSLLLKYGASPDMRDRDGNNQTYSTPCVTVICTM